MVMVHFVENLSGAVGFVPTGVAAPLFTFLSGVSYRLWLNSQEARGRSDSEISKVSIRRGLFLFGTGFLFNIFVWMPEDTFNWDILTFIGMALISLNVVRKMPQPIPVLMCAMIYGISPLLRQLSGYAEHWTNGYFECELTLSDVMLGFMVNGFFPIFPWIIFPVMGFTVASHLFPESQRGSGTLHRFVLLGSGLLLAAGILVLVRSYLPENVQNVWLRGWTMFPASAEYVLGSLGVAMLGFSVLHRWVDPKAKDVKESLLGRVATTFSTHSFTVYLLHHVVHLWPLWIYGMATTGEPTEHWMKAMPVTASLPLAMGFLFLCYHLLRWIDRTGQPSMESVLRWICD